MELLISMEMLTPLLPWKKWPKHETDGSMSALAQEVGADGYEFFPIDCTLTRRYRVGELLSYWKPAAARHSWRSEQNWHMLRAFFRNHWKDPVQCYIAFANYRRLMERRESMAVLASLGNRWTDVPIMIYPHHAECTIGGQRWNEPPYQEFAEMGGVKLVEPEPGLLAKDRWNVQAPEDLARTALAYGYGGFCLSYHTAVAWPGEMWQAAVDVFIPKTHLMRIDPYNMGSTEPYVPPAMDLLKYAVWHHGWDGPVVVVPKHNIPPWASRDVFAARCEEAIKEVRSVLG